MGRPAADRRIGTGEAALDTGTVVGVHTRNGQAVAGVICTTDAVIALVVAGLLLWTDLWRTGAGGRQFVELRHREIVCQFRSVEGDHGSEAEQETLEGHQCDQLYQNQWAGDLQRDLKAGRI